MILANIYLLGAILADTTAELHSTLTLCVVWSIIGIANFLSDKPKKE